MARTARSPPTRGAARGRGPSRAAVDPRIRWRARRLTWRGRRAPHQGPIGFACRLGCGRADGRGRPACASCRPHRCPPRRYVRPRDLRALHIDKADRRHRSSPTATPLCLLPRPARKEICLPSAAGGPRFPPRVRGASGRAGGNKTRSARCRRPAADPSSGVDDASTPLYEAATIAGRSAATPAGHGGCRSGALRALRSGRDRDDHRARAREAEQRGCEQWRMDERPCRHCTPG
jgi:hypothetical protein